MDHRVLGSSHRKEKKQRQKNLMFDNTRVMG